MATSAAENGATEHHLMAIFDWRTPGRDRICTEKARRKSWRGGSMTPPATDYGIGTKWPTANGPQSGNLWPTSMELRSYGVAGRSEGTRPQFAVRGETDCRVMPSWESAAISSTFPLPLVTAV